MKQIAEGLWQGALRHVHEQGLPAEITAVALMATQVESVPLRPGVLFIYFPIDDNADGLDAETFKVCIALADFLKDFKVLTICHMGENRSGLLSSLILGARGVDAETAVKTVQQRGNPNKDRGYSFWNPGFVRQVREWLG